MPKIIVTSQYMRDVLSAQLENYVKYIGTIPKIQSMEMMFSIGRSSRISMVPIIQSFAQLEKTYGKEGSTIIIDNCQDILFEDFAPNSESTDILSKALKLK
jgi:type IV secretion system protein VirD4